MILTQDQIYRYIRHIMIPEINRGGQEKVLASKVFLHSENLDNVVLALYYLAAAGVGQVYCSIDTAFNWEALSDKLLDLNSDCKILLMDEGAIESPALPATTRIITGSPGYVEKTLNTIEKEDFYGAFVPTVIAAYNGWNGAVKTLMEDAALKEFQAELRTFPDQDNVNSDDYSNKLSGYFSSLMAVVEHLKLVLSLGKPLSSPIYHNLSTMEFSSPGSYSALLLKLHTPIKKSQNQQSLFAGSKVLIVGCGDLGSAAAFTLATLGIGRFGLIDPDTVELGNLNPQIMHSSSRIGMSKVRSSEVFLNQTNPDIKVDIYDTRLDTENIQDIIGPYDIIIGDIDSPSERYMLKDACIEAGKPLLQAGVLDISGLATSIIPEAENCYHCILSQPEAESLLSHDSDTGVFGPLPGLLGIIQAAEAVKLLAGIGSPLKGKMLFIDVFDTDIYIADNEKKWHCESCGK